MAVISFKCPNCDGELIFDPATYKYKCEYCNSLFSQEELDAMKPASAAEPENAGEAESVTAGTADAGTADAERNNADHAGSGGTSDAGTGAESAGGRAGTADAGTGAESAETDAEEAVCYTCPSCGAEIVTDATTAATFCYYCHNPVVLGGRLEGKFLPNKVIPFEVTKEAAVKGFLDCVGKKKFVPKAFFNKKQIESMTGVYFPYWLYDVKLDGKLQGSAHNIRVWRTGDIEYTETRHYAIEREGEVSLYNLPENALQKANVKLASGVMPYHFDRMQDFHMGYLSGFMAERRDIEQAAVQNKMQCEMRESAEKLLRETVNGYNAVSVQNTNFVPREESWSYVLLPVWTITYKGHDGKIYYYSMNGQTGKVCGELPVDRKKLALASVLTGIGVFIIGLIGGFFL